MEKPKLNKRYMDKIPFKEYLTRILEARYGVEFRSLLGKVAKDCRCSYSTLYGIFKEGKEPTFDTFAVICQRLNFTFILTPSEVRIMNLNQDRRFDPEGGPIDRYSEQKFLNKNIMKDAFFIKATK
jgi:DNA-binding phage protein